MNGGEMQSFDIETGNFGVESTMSIPQGRILKKSRSIYQESQNIIQFMEQAYKYCLDNEQAIKAQML